MFRSVTEEAADEFQSKYKNSEEEFTDLKQAYVKFEGDLDRIFDSVMCSNPLDDEERFRALLSGWVADKVGWG